jgi:hypothetical protein
MSHTDYTSEEIVEKGEKIYSEKLQKVVETEDNFGKIISFDIETGEYEIDIDALIAGRRLLKRLPKAVLYGKRIGYNAVFALGGTLIRTAA